MEGELREMIKQKDQMEQTIEKLTVEIEMLSSVKNLDKNLTDAQGFPRADIDFGELTNFRNLKRRKAELNNDHKALMKQIQQKLFALHETYPKISANQVSETHEKKNTELTFKKKEKVEKVEEKVKSKIDYLTPFANLGIVFEGSPAEKAGIKVGDLLSELAEINIYSMEWQKEIASVVREGTEIRVVVLRKVQSESKSEYQVFRLKDGNDYEKRELQLVPGRWQGRGLLGCKIDPLSS